MRMSQKILAGIDLSSEAELVRSQLSYPNREVISQAINLAAASGAELCFYAVLDVSEEDQRLINAQSGTVGNVVDIATVSSTRELLSSSTLCGISVTQMFASSLLSATCLWHRLAGR